MTHIPALNDATFARRFPHTNSLTESRGNNRFRGESDAAASTAATAFVYLVDRDLPTVEYLSEQLTMCGYLVNCFDTIDQYAKFPRPALPSCLIVDADVSDTDLLRLEQGLQDGTQAPVILTSAYPDVPRVVRSIRAGALDFLSKPLAAIPSQTMRLINTRVVCPRRNIACSIDAVLRPSIEQAACGSTAMQDFD